MCVRACGHERGCCAAGVAADAAAPPGTRALVAHDSPRPVCRFGAGCSVVVAPPQCADQAHCRGRLRPAPGPSRPRTLPDALCGDWQKLRRSRQYRRRASGARGALDGAVGGGPRERHSRNSGRCHLVGARSAPLGASGGAEAAPAELGLAQWWPTATPGPGSAAVYHRLCRHGRQSAHAWVVLGLFRDTMTYHIWNVRA